MIRGSLVLVSLMVYDVILFQFKKIGCIACALFVSFIFTVCWYNYIALLNINILVCACVRACFMPLYIELYVISQT